MTDYDLVIAFLSNSLDIGVIGDDAPQPLPQEINTVSLALAGAVYEE